MLETLKHLTWDEWFLVALVPVLIWGIHGQIRAVIEMNKIKKEKKQMSTTSADKRSVSTDALETLGTIIDEHQKRDAIHLAVLPTVAAQSLNAGDHVNEKGEQVREGTGIGIVDPFLRTIVRPGQRFWLVVYPRVITSLRHVWQHPSLPDELSAQGSLFSEADVNASEEWLRNFCSNNDCPDYDTVIATIKGEPTPGRDEDDDYFHCYIEGGYFHVGGQDAHGEIPDEFWDHAEVVIGRKIRASNRAEYFSCSC